MLPSRRARPFQSQVLELHADPTPEETPDVLLDACGRSQQPAETGTSITLLVNSAGVGPSGPVLTSVDAETKVMIDLNVRVLHALTVAAARAFAARAEGGIINIASVVALMPEKFNGTYAAGKAFVLALTQALDVELRPKKVRIQAVLPGFTRTEIFDRAGVDRSVITPDGH
jgi:short-subunit dehydrogenase